MVNKANLNIVLSLLQDLNNDPASKAASTAAIAEANIKRNGVDRKDIHEIAVNSALDQIGNPIVKIKYVLDNNPSVVNDIVKSTDATKEIIDYLLQLGDTETLSELFADYLNSNGIEAFGEGGQFNTVTNTIKVKINNKTYNLLHLITQEEKEAGLMNVEDMDSDEGALFDYSKDPKNHLSFWMKDTTIALRILFINKQGVVISAHNGEPLSEKYITEESEPIYWVIELNQTEQIPQGAYTDLALYEEQDAEPEEDEEEDLEDHPELKVNKLYIYGSDGEVQGTIDSGCRIFSRKSTKVIIRKAKKAYLSKLDKDYKSLGRYVFNEIKAQDNRPAEYVSS